ncbi:cache domain-containing sensor histidine kinase [Butyrivibrio sp. XPD2006]|uniref:cache domain-containing sensor histidine kinase n=1 Tax=Butyrivibrio sp. XPD2006 TaxID=1280668 RepID=UPI0018CA62A7|nr:sensor histidine kinase [Butyrivibrio sp. XPD2006]
MKLRMRFFLIYFLCSLLMLFGAMQYFLYRYTLVSTEKANQMLENTMYSATAQVENMVGAITNATYLFQANGTTSGSIIDELQKYKDMNYDMSYYDLYTSRQNIKYICQTLLISNPNINGIFVILANNQTLGWSNGIDFDYKYKPAEDDWYKETLDLHGRLYISDLSKKDFFLGAGESVFFAKALHNIYTNDYLGTVLIDCSPEIFDLSSVNMLPSDIYISLTDADNPDSIYYANTETPIAKELFEDDPLFISKDILNGNFTMNVAMNHDYFADSVSSATRQMYLVALLIMAILALVYIPLLNGVIKPIRKLTNHMHATHFRQPANMPRYSKRNDEIGLMYREYDAVVKSLNEYIRKDYQNKLATMDAQMRALEAQIDAHFLFNTLETINSIAEIEEVEPIQTISMALANMFRYSIKTQSELVPLRDEINHIRNYISIQNIRYDNRFTVDIQITEETLNERVLKLILQPVIENSINHGFKRCQIRGKILIEAYTDESNLYIRISDDGVGMNETQLEKLKNLLNSKPAVEELGKRVYESIGIKNINSRIQLYYGTMYGLDVDSVENEGTTALITVPRKQERKQNV